MNMNKIILLFLTFAFLIPASLSAQSSRWKRTRYEVVGGLGVTGFMGDLGGGDESSHFIGDFDFMSQRYVLSGGLRYKLLEPLAVKVTLAYGQLAGADSKAENKYRQDRNLTFRSPLLELGGQLEYSILKEPANHRYNLRRRKKFSFKNIKINTYLFAGIAGFWFNPKGPDDGEGGSGDWVKLQPLGTEGQGLMEGREKYSRIQLAIPFGIGFKYNLNRKIAIGFEYGARWTFTDYIDDVSSTYIDNAWLAESSELAARMADPSIQTNDDSDPLPNVTYSAGNQRGEAKYNDFYMFSQITIAYKLRTGRNGLPKF